MRKLILILTLISSSASAQITIKGRVFRVENCTLTDSGCVRLSYIQPTATFFHFSDTKFFINGTLSGVYRLFDKDTTGFEKDRTISYMARTNKRLYLIAIKEIPDTNDELVIAVFPYDGNVKFKQYIVKIRQPKLKK